MQIGLIPASAGAFPVTGPEVAAVARSAERAGFDSIWIGEHVVMSPRERYPGADGNRVGPSVAGSLPDPLEWLTYAAAVTERILLGTSVLLVPLHSALVLAKRVATLDRLSGGRVRLGIGLGWSEDEYRAVGVPFHERGRRCDEAVGALRALWSDSPARFDGRFVRFGPVHSAPQPLAGRVPIFVGGDSDAAARRAGRIGDGYFPFAKDRDRLRRLVGVARQAAVETGRDPDALELTGLGSLRREAVAELASLGFSRMVLFLGAPTVEAVAELAEQALAVTQGL